MIGRQRARRRLPAACAYETVRGEPPMMRFLRLSACAGTALVLAATPEQRPER